MNNKAIILARVSTEIQDLEAQKNQMIKFVKEQLKMNYIIIENKESAIKLSEEEREGINLLKVYINTDEDIKAVVIWEISRLARKESILYSVRDLLIEKKIQLYILDKNYKLLDENGNLDSQTDILFSLYAYFARSEMQIKKARFKRAREYNNQRGKYNGGFDTYGYYIDENGYYKINEEQSKNVIMIFTLYATGKFSLRGLYKELNERGYNFNLDFIIKMIKNPIFAGLDEKRKLPPIISEDLFKQCENVRTKNRTWLTSRNSKETLCNKLIKCPICGNHFSLINRSYQCTYLSLHKCTNNDTITQLILDKLIWFVTTSNIRETVDEYLIKKYQSEYLGIQQKIIATDKKLSDFPKKLERLKNLYIDGDIEKKVYQQKKLDLENKKNLLEEFQDSLILERQRIARFMRKNSDDEDVKTMNFDKRFKLVRDYIQQITISKDENSRRMTYIHILMTDNQKLEYLIDTKTGKAKYIDLKYDKDITSDVENL